MFQIFLLTLALASAAPRPPASTLGLPLTPQKTDYSCGPAALLSVLRYWGAFDGNEHHLFGPLGTTPKDGTMPDKLAEYAASRGLDARLTPNMTIPELRKALASGAPVILDIQAWQDEDLPFKPWQTDWDDGHYVVAAGIDDKNVYVMDPSVEERAFGYIPLAELLLRWHDYEEYDGKRVEHQRLGIVIRGKGKPAPAEAPKTTVRVR
jgi:predicted double-glycine peptidase